MVRFEVEVEIKVVVVFVFVFVVKVVGDAVVETDVETVVWFVVEVEG
jgi:hypothetical protein